MLGLPIGDEAWWRASGPAIFSQFAVASICRALRKSRSRSTPGGVPIACLRRRFASSRGSSAIAFKRATLIWFRRNWFLHIKSEQAFEAGRPSAKWHSTAAFEITMQRANRFANLCLAALVVPVTVKEFGSYQDCRDSRHGAVAECSRLRPVQIGAR